MTRQIQEISATSEITTIGALIDQVRARIPQSQFGRGRDLIAELRDGLEDAADSYRSAGLGAKAAERRAVEEFGVDEIDRIARECREELGTVATVRAAVVVGLGYAVILGCWGVYYAIFGSSQRFDNGVAAGNGFTAIGVATLVFAVATLGLLRRRARNARDVRPIAIGFGILTFASLLATYLLAGLSHRPPGEPEIVLTAAGVVEFLTTLVTAAMVWTALDSLRHVGVLPETAIRGTN
jgi:hypothetical protein